ncbi:MAG: hypothetical protein NC830_04885, partial [Candidatus Omnitrophica bacterium]|nr:hypothetical protein [Candidatus Omnitrophota bacterium]
MKVQREIFCDLDEKGRPVFPGFVSYIHESEPLIIHRYGRLDFSDGYDDFCDSFSQDNGKTFSNPILRLKSYKSGEKIIRYAENACFFDKDRKKLFTFMSKRTYINNRIEVDGPSCVVYDVFDFEKRQWQGEKEINIKLPGQLLISFCFPLQIDDDTVLIPAITHMVDQYGASVHDKGWWASANMSLVIKMRINVDDSVVFTAGNPVGIDLEKSSRGIGENTIAKLENGRIVMVCRGD